MKRRSYTLIFYKQSADKQLETVGLICNNLFAILIMYFMLLMWNHWCLKCSLVVPQIRLDIRTRISQSWTSVKYSSKCIRGGKLDLIVETWKHFLSCSEGVFRSDRLVGKSEKLANWVNKLCHFLPSAAKTLTSINIWIQDCAVATATEGKDVIGCFFHLSPPHSEWTSQFVHWIHENSPSWWSIAALQQQETGQTVLQFTVTFNKNTDQPIIRTLTEPVDHSMIPQRSLLQDDHIHNRNILLMS